MNPSQLSESFLKWCLLGLIFCSMLSAQEPAKTQASAELQHVLSQMDQSATGFRSTQAAFVWDQYQKVVDETDTQKGTVYFRRNGNEIQMAAEIDDASVHKSILFAGSKIQVYEPKIDQVTTYNVGKDRDAFEGFLVLGFGGSGRDMLKSFDVSYLGSEKVDGVETAKLDLVPKSEKVRNTFGHIWLWIDTARGVSVQQKMFSPSGDYRLAKYSDIQLNQKIADTAFRLKTTPKTKFVSPQG